MFGRNKNMKKQIAVLMAAATAVTTVAPVLASADVNTHEDSAASTAVEKAKAALAVKYSDKKVDGLGKLSANEVPEFANSRYIVLVNKAGQEFKAVNTSYYKDADFSFKYKDGQVEKEVNKASADWFVVDDVAKLEKLIEANPDAVVAVVDKGADKGSAFRTLTKKHYVAKEAGKNDATEASLEKLVETLVGLAKENADSSKATFVESLKVDGKDFVVAKAKVAGAATDKYEKVELKLASGVNFTFEVNSTVVDLTKAMDKNNQFITGTNNEQNVLDTVVKFAEVENDENKTLNVDIPYGDTDVYFLKDVQTAPVEVVNVFTRDGGYTEKGADFVNNFNKVGADDKVVFNYGGYNYKAAKADVEAAFAGATIAKVKDGSFELKLKAMPVVDTNDRAHKRNLQFVIKGKTQADLDTVLRDLKEKKTVVAGHFTRLDGADRYATAIEISKKHYEDDKAKSVVIVGGEAQFDGLSAAPLAAKYDAPLLLAHPKKGLSQATLDEIARAVDTVSNKTLYIVGGENSVPASVEKQLKDKFGVTVVRLAGSDRTATSLEVARRFKYDVNDKAANGFTKAFFVGANGAADAMSVSAVAARADLETAEIAPIIVMKKDGFNRATRAELGNITNAYIVGGTASISSEGYKAVKTLNDGNVTVSRLSGADRYATNMEVVNKFFTGADKTKGLIVASGANKYLVDAQTAGAFAAKKKAPIVLAGDKMTSDQTELFKKDYVKALKDVVQVGGVVSSNFMKQVVEKLGL